LNPGLHGNHNGSRPCFIKREIEMKNMAAIFPALHGFTKGRPSTLCTCASVLACFLLFGTNGNAAVNIYSTNSGDWSNAATWSTPPVNGSPVYVTGNETVTFKAGDSYTGGNVGGYGSLVVGVFDTPVGAGNGGPGTLNITGGTITTGDFSVGVVNGNAGTINQSGGTFNAIGDFMLFGWGATATMNISGGTMNMTGAGIDKNWNIGHTAASSINVTGSGVAHFTGGMKVGAWSVINADGGTINFEDATLHIAAGSQLKALKGGSINLNGGNTITGDGGFVVGGGGAVHVNSGANTFTGTVSLADAATITAGSGTLLTLNPGTGAAVSLTAGRTLTIAGTGSVQVNGAITGTGNLVLAGATSADRKGTVTLSGNNTFSGYLQAGGSFGMTLRVGHDNALGAGTVHMGQNVVLASDGTATRTIGNTVNLANVAYYGDTTGTGDLIFTGSNVASGNQRIMNVRNSTTISGVVSGTGGVDKRGTGTLILSGNNTYEMGTTVNEGGLIVDGSLAASSAVRVVHGALIGGSGTIGGNLTLNSGSFLVFDPTLSLTVSGTVVLDNSFGVASLKNADGTPIVWNHVADGTYTLLGGTTSTFNNIANFGLVNAADIEDGRKAYFENGSLRLVVIPKPPSNGKVSATTFASGTSAGRTTRRSSNTDDFNPLPR